MVATAHRVRGYKPAKEAVDHHDRTYEDPHDNEATGGADISEEGCNLLKHNCPPQNRKLTSLRSASALRITNVTIAIPKGTASGSFAIEP